MASLLTALILPLALLLLSALATPGGSGGGAGMGWAMSPQHLGNAGVSSFKSKGWFKYALTF